MALLFHAHKVNLFNATSNTEEPDKLAASMHHERTLGLGNLLAVRHTPTGGWCADVYALEQRPPQQTIFDELHTNLPLPPDVAMMPAQV